MVVLAYSASLLDADPIEITAAANAIEVALGSPRRHRAEVLTRVAEHSAVGRGDLIDALAAELRVQAPSFAVTSP